MASFIGMRISFICAAMRTQEGSGALQFQQENIGYESLTVNVDGIETQNIAKIMHGNYIERFGRDVSLLQLRNLE